MKRFKFRLQTILDYRKQLKKDLEEKLALKYQKLHEQQRELQHFEVLNQNACNEFNRMLQSGCSPIAAKFYIEYLYLINENIKSQKRNIEETKRETMLLRDELLEAVKNEKVLDNLRERRWQAYLYNFYKEEEKVLDNVMSYSISREDKNV